MGNSTISMAIFNSYVSLPEGRVFCGNSTCEMIQSNKTSTEDSCKPSTRRGLRLPPGQLLVSNTPELSFTHRIAGMPTSTSLSTRICMRVNSGQTRNMVAKKNHPSAPGSCLQREAPIEDLLQDYKT